MGNTCSSIRKSWHSNLETARIGPRMTQAASTGLAQLLGDPGIRGVARDADMHHAARAVRDDEAGVERPEEEVGDGEEVAGPDGPAWLRRNVAQDCPARRGGRASRMCRWTVVLATRMPSLRSSPWIRSAPHSRFAAAISLMRATVPAATFGCGADRGGDFPRQKRRKPCRCQRSRVSGWTISSAWHQARRRLASSTRSARAVGVQRGRLPLRRRTRSCWRRKAFSAMRAGRPRTRSASAPVTTPCSAGFVAMTRHCRRARARDRPRWAHRRNRRVSIKGLLIA